MPSFITGGIDSNPPLGVTPSFNQNQPAAWRLLYATGFEQPDFAPAGVSGQAGWTGSNIGGGSAVVTNTTPPTMDGAQWVHFVNPGTAGFKSAQIQYPFPLSDVAGKPYRVRASFLNDGTPIGPAYMFANLGVSGPVASTRLFGDGSILVTDSAGPTIIGATWAYGVRQNLELLVNAARTSWTLSINGVAVYTGVPVNLGGPESLAFGLQKTSGLTVWEAGFDTVSIEAFF